MLTDLYTTLKQSVPEDEGTLYGSPVGERDAIWLSVDRNAHPALLLPAREDDVRPDIVLRSVDARFSRVCTIETATGQSQGGCYSLIRLKENDVDIVRLFLRILEERFCIDLVPSNNAAIASNIQEIAALFSRVDERPRDLIGLWGELHVIYRSGAIPAAVRCWCTCKTAKFDFVTDSFVLDVKATLSVSRKHRFSLEQLRPAGNFDTYIASLCLIETQSGQTVGALMDAIAIQIADTNLRSAFLRQCVAKGGRDLYRSELALQTYPDEGAASLFRAPSIPVPLIDKGDPIENVRFDVDLSAFTPLDDEMSRTILRFQQDLP